VPQSCYRFVTGATLLSVLRGTLGAVDDEDLERDALRVECEPELLPDRGGSASGDPFARTDATSNRSTWGASGMEARTSSDATTNRDTDTSAVSDTARVSLAQSIEDVRDQ
jgi:hypothetical protein